MKPYIVRQEIKPQPWMARVERPDGYPVALLVRVLGMWCAWWCFDCNRPHLSNPFRFRRQNAAQIAWRHYLDEHKERQ